MPCSRRSLSAAGALCAVALLYACHVPGVNGSVHVPAGSTADDATTVNGGVRVDDGAKVGKAATVNGGVHLGANVTAASVETVNGGIHIGSNTRVANDVETVNGGIRLDRGADVGGKVENVNGGILLNAAHVGDDISTFNGDVEIGAGSRVDGGIRIRKPEFSTDTGRRVPRVVIGPGAVVRGALTFEREVKLYVSNSAKIGPVTGATAEMFSGDMPGNDAPDSSDEPAAGGPEKE